MLKRFMDQLDSSSGLRESITKSEEGSFSLDLEPNLHICLSENPESGICLYAVLAPLPEKNKEEFLLSLMKANLFGRETGGAALGIDKEGKQVTFLTFLPEEINYRDFHDCLEDFVNYADAWKVEITEFSEKTNRD